jgi:serine/threonine protein kinase
MINLIGVTINNYEIQEELGGGGMGIVYRARHPIMHKDVAIKVMRPELTHQESFYVRFEAEAQNAARLNHRGIVSVTNFGWYEGIAYLIMELIKGPSLRALLRDSPFGLPLKTAVVLIMQVAKALAYAHGKGVLHLDLKPDNILLDPEISQTSAFRKDCPYRPVIGDFGLARLMAAKGVSINAAQSIGTPHYMSPEHCKGESLNEGSDIYSLGVTLFETLTGERPFPINRTTSPQEAAHYHCDVLPEPPSRHIPSLPSTVDDLVLTMLAKRPDERPSSARQVAEQLEDILTLLAPRGGEIKSAAKEGTIITPNGVDRWSTDQAAPFQFEVKYPGKQTDRVPMDNELIRVGRLPTCDLRLEAQDVSKKHCEIRWRKGEMAVRDLHSLNGTYLDDVLLQPGVFYRWPAGIIMRVGPFELKWFSSRARDEEQSDVRLAEKDAPETDGPRIECQHASPITLRLTTVPATIGRLPSSDLVIADACVSRRHCQVCWDGERVLVKDLNSHNGTRLGEELLESDRVYPWPPDTDLRIGPYTVRLVGRKTE